MQGKKYLKKISAQIDLFYAMGKLSNEMILDEQIDFILEKNPDFPQVYKTDLIQLIGKKRREIKDTLREPDKKELAAINFINSKISDEELTELNQNLTNTEFGMYYEQITNFMENLNEENLSDEELYVIMTSYQAIGGKISRKDKKIVSLPKDFRDFEGKIKGTEEITKDDTERMKTLNELFENRKQQAILEITSEDGSGGGNGGFRGIKRGD